MTHRTLPFDNTHVKSQDPHHSTQFQPPHHSESSAQETSLASAFPSAPASPKTAHSSLANAYSPYFSPSLLSASPTSHQVPLLGRDPRLPAPPPPPSSPPPASSATIHLSRQPHLHRLLQLHSLSDRRLLHHRLRPGLLLLLLSPHIAHRRPLAVHVQVLTGRTSPRLAQHVAPQRPAQRPARFRRRHLLREQNLLLRVVEGSQASLREFSARKRTGRARRRNDDNARAGKGRIKRT